MIPSRSLLFVCAWVASAFVAVGQVTISDFSPQFGSPGDMVTIQGTGFSAGTVQVWFNGTKSTYAGATSANVIQAQVPTGATTGPISVKIGASATVSSLQDFTVIGAGPYITGWSPNSSVPNEWFIDGTHFAPTAQTAVTNVYFDGKPVRSLQVQSTTRLKVTTPLNVTSGFITVKSPLGTAVSSTPFYVPPEVASFSPTSGRAGTWVVIKGKNFLDATGVLFNGSNTFFVVSNNTTIGAQVPPATAKGKVRVNAPAGSATSTNNFIMLPTIHSFTPSGGAPGTTVVIAGENLNVGTTKVFFNGASAVLKSNATFSTVAVTVPAAATTGPISVTTTDGSHTSSQPFYIPPVITSFLPNNSPAGSRVTISGQNFIGATNVMFDGIKSPDFIATNNNIIFATVPTNVVTGRISVWAPAGTALSTNYFFGLPKIFGFTPVHGLPGDAVLITGTNLLGATAVKFNGVDATWFAATNNGFIHAEVPGGASAGSIAVFNPAGSDTSTNLFQLDYVDLAVGITVTPSVLFQGSNSVWLLTVTNRGPAESPNTILTNDLPAGMVLVSLGTSQGSIGINTGPVVADLGTLPAHASAVVTQVYRTVNLGNVLLSATARSSYKETAPADNTAVFSASVYPPATITAQSTNQAKQIRISWPAALGHFTLQHRFGLDPTNAWMNNPRPRTTNGSVITVVDTNNAPAKFYRLVAPAE